MRTLLHRLAVGALVLWAFILPAAAQGLTPTVTLAGLPGSTVPGNPLVVTAGVFGASGPATGTAAFDLRNLGTNVVVTICGATTLDPAGNAACGFITPSTGSWRIEVAYSGDSTYAPGGGTFVFSTAQAAPSIALSGLPASTVPGRTVLVQAHVSSASPLGNPTGSAAFVLRNLSTGGVTPVCGATTLDSNGDAACGFITPANGSYQLEVQYSGDAPNAALTQPFAFSTQQAVVSFSTSGFSTLTYPGATLPMVVRVTSASPVGNPTGTAAFRLLSLSTGGSVYVCGPTTLDSSGDAACTFIAPSNGNYQLHVEYSGDASNAPLSVGYSFTTQQATPTINLSGLPSSPLPGAGIVVVTHITSPLGNPSGNAAFLLRNLSTNGSAYVCGATTLDASGDAACGFVAPVDGTYQLEVEYSGDTPNSPAMAVFPFTVVTRVPTISAIRPSSGAVAGGSTVEFEGTDLDYVGVVTFGGAGAWINRSTPTAMTVTIPAHAAGLVDVYVRTGDNTASSTVTNGFAYVDNDDVARDFSAYANPSPRWTYGWEPSRGGAFTISTTHTVDSGMDVWTNPTGAPTVWHNPTAATIDVATNSTPAGKLGMHPGPGGENSVVRWTAPSTGVYHVEGSFTGADAAFPTTSDVAVLRNNDAVAPLFAAAISSFGAPSPFSVNVFVNGGETIEFTVGFGGNGYSGDATLLDAVVTLLAPGPPPPPPATVPGAPSLVTAVAGNGGATVFFQPAPANGSPITLYTVISNPGGITVSSPASPIGISGLANGTTYTFTVFASNSVGAGPASAPSNPVTPAGAAAVPMTYTFSGIATGTLGTSSFNDAAITVTATGDASLVVGNGTYCNALSNVSFTIAGVGSGVATDLLAMFANNSNSAVGIWRGCGTSDWIGMYADPALYPAMSTYALNSAVSATAFAQYAQGDLNTTAGVLSIVTSGINQFNSTLGAAPPATVPGAPVIGTAGIDPANSAQVAVSFAPPASNGGSSITGYTATASPGGATASGPGSPITLTGLSTCVVYTVTVTATNAVGTSAPSAASNAISLPGATPAVPAPPFFTPSSVVFASRTVSTTSPAETVTITNGGACPISIASMAITGDFAFVSACPATLAAGATCTVDIKFTPLVVGARAGSLTVNSTTFTGASSQQVLPLSGTGAAGAVPVAGISPPMVDFAAQAVDTDSAPQLVTVRNTGTATLVFGPIAVDGDFRQVALPAGTTAAACPVDLAPGASCQIAVLFHPTAVNLRTGTLAISINAGTSPINVSLAGTGLTPLAPQLAVPASLAFEPQPVGTKSAGKAVALANTSGILATITELSASGDFSVSDTCTAIAAGTTCSPLVFFQPTEIGPRSGALTVRTLRDLDPYVVELTGTGEENRRPVLQLSLTRVGFGNAFIGSATPVRIDLRNVGQGPAVIESILATGPYLVTNGCTVIAPGASCSFEVAFVPGMPGAQAAAIQIHSNAEGSPHRIELSGTGCLVPSPSRARLGLLLCGS